MSFISDQDIGEGHEATPCLANLSWAELELGMAATFKRSISESDIRCFAKLSGDHNPIHTDRAHSRSQGHSDLVCHGLLTAAFYSTLVGMHLPGRSSFLHGVDAKFRAAVYPGDELTIRGEVSYMNEAYKQIEIKATIRNQHKKLVSTATLKVGVIGG